MPRPTGPHGPRRSAGLAAALLPGLLLVSIASLVAPDVATAQFGSPEASLSLAAPAQSVAGRSVGVVATLTQQGNPIAGVRVTLRVDFAIVGTSVTDAQGAAAFTIPGSSLATPGTYQLRAFAGGYNQRASASVTLTVVAAASHPAPSSPVRTSVSVQAPNGSQVGQDVTVTATLRDASGHAVAGQNLIIDVQGSQLKSGLTDSGGHLVYAIPGRKLPAAGSYLIQALYMGSHLFSPSSAQTMIVVVSAAIRVQTVPPVPGLSFSLDGTPAVTGPDGIAAWPVPQSGTYKLTADLNPDGSADPDIRASFIGWADGVPTLDRSILANGPATYVVGLKVAYRDHLNYVDMAGHQVDPAIVDQALITAQNGTAIAINPQTGSSFWSTAIVAQAVPNAVPPALVTSPMAYRVTSVKVHGVEALAPGQPTWTPDQETWTVQLALYDLTVRTTDAVTGGPATGTIHLGWADGSTDSKVVHDGTAVFSSLPAGQYLIRRGSGPLASSRTVRLSGTQTDTLPVFTFEDALMVAAGGLILLSLGLAGLVAVRRHRRVPV